jgi:formate dehydrogenase major subunit
MTVHLTINGKPVEVPEGTTVLRAAQNAGIHIPTLCDHPHLKPSGGCRLCMVDVQGFRGPTASCTLPAGEGMVVTTDTEQLIESRKFILSMLFSERNHLCPFCEVSGGDCELQNVSYGVGMTHWEYPPAWAKFPLDASHGDIVIDHNRCILCRRCVRACAELVGNFTLGLSQRGARTMLTADTGAPLGESTCVACGMCVQVCPTGAMIDRHSAYLGKTAQLTRTRTVCIGCSVGCGVEVYTRDNQIVGIQGDWDSPVNGGLTCKLGRFEPMKDKRRRILEPMIRKNGKLQAVSWDEALNAAAGLLKARPVAAIASTRLTTEALAQFRQLFRDNLGASEVTSVEEGLPTATSAALADRACRPFETGLDALERSECVFLIGVNPTDRHEVISFQIKRRLNDGLKLVIADPVAGPLEHFAAGVLRLQPGGDATLLRAIADALLEPADGLDPELSKAARILKNSDSVALIYGKGLTAQPGTENLDALLALAETLRLTPGANGAAREVALLSVKGEANSLAASQLGLDRVFQADASSAVYLALGDDYPNRRLLERMQTAAVKIVQASYASAATEMADVILPVGNWAEQSGHFVSLDGRVQKAEQLVTGPQDVRSNLAVLEDLSRLTGAQSQVNWQSLLQERVAPVALQMN